MKTDPVVEEIRARGRALTARYGNEANALLKLLAERAEACPEGVVDTVKVVATMPTVPASRTLTP